MHTAIELKNINKHFGDYHAVNDVSFQIEEGSFFSLLGPSGCGKTTLLRMIAGLESPDSGDILFDDTSIIKAPIEKRNIGMVFQNYALFPHMSVYNNIAYGLKIKKQDPDMISETISYHLKLMNLLGLEKRLPHELSGGQQQRVALARALVTKPFLLLLDEPLSNLDVKLREEIREELLRIKLETKITTIYVTHDQSEALYLADQIAVMKLGVVQQLDASKEIYHRPSSEYIANFVGETNLIKVNDLKNLLGEKIHQLNLQNTETCSLRPELINFSSGDISIKGTVAEYRFYGMISSIMVQVPQLSSMIKVIYFSDESNKQHSIGDEITVHFRADALIPMVK